MKYPLTLILGVCLIIAGGLALLYPTYTAPRQENVLQIGDLHVTENTNKTETIPPYVGGIGIVAGIALVVLGRKK
jgi:uncharacterized membrane protein HdeD (DUF308 family)